MLSRSRGCFWLSLLALVACAGERVSELLIGATENTAMGVDAGAAYVIFGGAM